MRSRAQQWRLATVLLGLFGSLAHAAHFPIRTPRSPSTSALPTWLGA